jgi:prepilin-type processing-associated H-X9-DG protein
LQPYIKNWQAYLCPSGIAYGSTTYHGTSYPIQPNYAVNNNIFRAVISLGSIQSPSSKWYIADSNHPVLGDIRGYLTSSACGHWTCGTNVNTTHIWETPHNSGLNIGFCDGHAKWAQGNSAWGDYNNGAMNPTTP